MTHHSPSWSEQLESWSHCLALAYRSHWSLASRWADGRIYCEPSQMAHQHLRDVMPSSLLSTPITPSLNQLEQRLLQQYALSAFKQQCSTIRYSDTLAYLCYLEALTSPNPHEFWQAFSHFSPLSCLRWWDVGCKNWSYLQALAAFALTTHPNAQQCFEITGIELDHRRLYWDGYTRGAHGRAYAASSQTPRLKAHYLGGNALQHVPHQPYHLISLFLPFIVPEPCLDWGLPLSCLQPERLLNHVIDQLAPGGWLLIINQGADEYAVQADLLTPAINHGTLRVDWTGDMPETPWAYEEPRYGWRLAKKV